MAAPPRDAAVLQHAARRAHLAWMMLHTVVGGAVMSIVAWIVLGLIAGFIASKLVNKSGEGLVLDILLGVVGAVVGGFLFSLVGATGVTGFNIWSMFVAVMGAMVFLVIKHAVMGRSHAHS